MPSCDCVFGIFVRHGRKSFCIYKHLHNPVADGVRIGHGNSVDRVRKWREITQAFDHCDVAVYRANADILGRCFRVWGRIRMGEESGLSIDMDRTDYLYVVLCESALNFIKNLLQTDIVLIEHITNEQETNIS